MVFCDEAVMNLKIIQKKAFSNKNCNIVLMEWQLDELKVNLIISMSYDDGEEVFTIVDKPANTETFLTAMADCEYNYGPYTIFGDGVSYHRSKMAIQKYMKRQNSFIRCVAHMP